MKAYFTVALVLRHKEHPTHLDEVSAHSFEELQETIGEMSRQAAETGAAAELWVLLHDHDPIGEDEPCECRVYVTQPAPYATFSTAEEPA